jgi:hypothetical protein
MENNFRIRDDFILRYRRRNYNYKDIAQAVSYWLTKINKIDEGPIGVAYATLSFSSIAFLLALYKSQRSFKHLGVVGREINETLILEHGVSSIFVVGDLYHSTINLDHVTDQLHQTDTWDHAYACAQWNGYEELNIPFTDKQIVYAFTSGSTGKPKPVSMSAYLESLSIQLAMDSFFVEDDYCVFSHGMAHMGVHTTAILPGLFKAQVVSLADHTWKEEILHATHIQFFNTTSFLPLPKKLRVLTTGGNMLSSVFLTLITDQCEVESIYDIYGLTECLPPLAVRKVQSVSDLNLPFDWINLNYQIAIIGDIIKITRPDDVVFLTKDRGSLIGNKLKFLGRELGLIRVDGRLLGVEQFKQTLEKSTKILDYAIEYANNEFVLHALLQDQDSIASFIINNGADVVVKYHDTLNTNGGIKNIS